MLVFSSSPETVFAWLKIHTYWSAVFALNPLYWTSSRLFVPMNLTLEMPNWGGNMQDCSIPPPHAGLLSVTCSRFIPVVISDPPSFCFRAVTYSIVRPYPFYPSIEGHRSFCFLAFLNNASVNTGVHIWFQDPVFSSLGWRPKSMVAEPHSSFNVNFLKLELGARI